MKQPPPTWPLEIPEHHDRREEGQVVSQCIHHLPWKGGRDLQLLRHLSQVKMIALD